jgi:hypothetical protein
MFKPNVIVEIGSDTGHMTVSLAKFVYNSKNQLHIIDPSPRYDPNMLEKFGKESVIFHPLTSLEALPQIHHMDVVFIDGDHNYYTVFNELHCIRSQALADDHPFPLILLHDVDWPYARRDLYYNPQTIPPEGLHPYAKKGIIKDESALAETGGFNAHLYHATHEGGPKNGVLTAIEDFIQERDNDLGLTLMTLPINFGLGIIVSEALLKQNPACQKFLNLFQSPSSPKMKLLYNLRKERKLLRGKKAPKGSPNTVFGKARRLYARIGNKVLGILTTLRNSFLP